MSQNPDQPDPLIDRLSDMDEMMENQVIPNQRAIMDALGKLGSGGVPGVQSPESYTYSFSRNVPANTLEADPLTAEVEMPFDVLLKDAVVIWPPGAENRVGVKIRTKSGERLFPRNAEEEYEAADDFGYPFSLRTQVDSGTVVVAEYINFDTANPHYINCALEVDLIGTEAGNAN